MLDKLPIKATASVEKKTSCGFLCRHCVCKSLWAHDLLAVSCFQLAKWCKVIGLHAFTTTLPPSLCVIFLPPSCSDRVSPACTSLFQLRGSRCRAASCAPCSHQGQGRWNIPASIMERDFGSGTKQTLCIPWDISEVMDEVEEEQFCPWVVTLNLRVAAAFRGDRLSSVCPPAWQGCLQQLPSSPSEGDLGRGQLQGGHPLYMHSVTGGYEAFGNNWKRKKFNLDDFWKRRQLQASSYANMCIF